jgi:hypothetical protein
MLSDLDTYWSAEFRESVVIREVSEEHYEVYIDHDYAFESYSLPEVEDLLGKMVVIRG